MGRFWGAGNLRCRNFVLPRGSFGGRAWAARRAGGGGAPRKNTEGLPNVQPVGGRVSFEGRRRPGGVVLFPPAADPDSHKKRIAGIVDEEGSFEMSTTV